MAEVTLSSGARGDVHLDLLAGAGGEVRDVVELDELEDASRIAALGSIALEFDFYGRLVGLRISGSPQSVLPPALLEQLAAPPPPR